MQYKIEWLIPAIDDLNRLRNNLENRGAYETGYKVANELYSSVDRLSDMPRMFPKFQDTPLRRMVVKDYSVFYRIDEEKKLVKIEYIRHHLEDISDISEIS